MKKIPEISESEHQVMKVIWNKNPITAVEITKKLSKKTDWKFNTIKTFLNRLLKKKAIGYDKSGKEFNYYPLMEEADFVKAESKIFLKRVFGGMVKPMLVAMADEEDLTLEDIEELRRHIKSKKQEK